MQINGVERRLLFNINALIELDEDHGIDILNPSGLKGLKLKQIRAIAFVGMKHGVIEDGKEVDFTLQDVGKWLRPDKFADLFGELEKQNNGDRKEAEGGKVGESIGQPSSA